MWWRTLQRAGLGPLQGHTVGRSVQCELYVPLWLHIRVTLGSFKILLMFRPHYKSPDLIGPGPGCVIFFKRGDWCALRFENCFCRGQGATEGLSVKAQMAQSASDQRRLFLAEVWRNQQHKIQESTSEMIVQRRGEEGLNWGRSCRNLGGVLRHIQKVKSAGINRWCTREDEGGFEDNSHIFCWSLR